MRRSYKSILGVTLLEIMLVLAIAAMIIVMSIRYYQSASNNQKVAAAADQLIAIIAAGESYLGAVGNLGGISSTAIGNYLPGATMPNTPWGGSIAITVGASSPVMSYTISYGGIPSASCTNLLAMMTSQNAKITGSACTAITVNEAVQ